MKAILILIIGVLTIIYRCSIQNDTVAATNFMQLATIVAGCIALISLCIDIIILSPKKSKAKESKSDEDVSEDEQKQKREQQAKKRKQKEKTFYFLIALIFVIILYVIGMELLFSKVDSTLLGDVITICSIIFGLTNKTIVVVLRTLLFRK